MNNYRKYLKYCLKRSIFESTEMSEDIGDLWNSFKKGLAGDYYKDTLEELKKYLSKCIRERNLTGLFYFSIDNYNVSCNVQNFRVNKSFRDRLEESVFLEDLKEIPEDLINQLSQYNPEDIKTIVDKAMMSKEWYYLRLENLLKEFPDLGKSDKISLYTDLIEILAKNIYAIFKFGLKQDPTSKTLKKSIKIDELNPYFEFDLEIKYKVINSSKAERQRIDGSNNDESILSVIANIMKDDPEVNGGKLAMYGKFWKFNLEVFNTEEIIKFESKVPEYEDEKKFVMDNLKKDINEYRSSVFEQIKTLNRRFSNSKSDNKEELETYEPIRRKINENWRNLNSELKNNLMSITNNYMKNLKIRPLSEKEKKSLGNNASRVSELIDINNEMLDATMSSINSSVENYKKILDKQKSDQEDLIIETPDEIKARARKGIVDWLLRNQANPNDIHELSDGTIEFKKEIIVGKREDPRSPEVEFTISIFDKGIG